MRDPHDHRVDRARVGEATYAEAAMHCDPMTRLLIREHCRGARRHAEWARTAEVDIDDALADMEEGQPDAGYSHVNAVRHRSNGHWAVAAVHLIRALALLALLSLAPTVAAAQSDEVMTLRTCLSERGFRTDVDDCVIVVEVVRARMERRGGSYAENLRALAPHLLGSPCNVSRRWLCDIDVDCHRPRGLVGTWTTPRGDEPSRYTACVSTVAEVRELLASEASRCEERPAHWGSRADVARRIAAGFRWRDAECPGLVLLNRAGFLYRRLPIDRE